MPQQYPQPLFRPKVRRTKHCYLLGFVFFISSLLCCLPEIILYLCKYALIKFIWATSLSSTNRFLAWHFCVQTTLHIGSVWSFFSQEKENGACRVQLFHFSFPVLLPHFDKHTMMMMTIVSTNNKFCLFFARKTCHIRKKTPLRWCSCS